MSGKRNTVLVFTIPESLKFEIGSKKTHSQVLTLYNLYDIPVKFKVMCHSKSRDKYKVTDSDGVIASKCGVEVLITHKSPIVSNCDVVDRFKILIFDRLTDQPLGAKYVDCMLQDFSATSLRSGATNRDDSELEIGSRHHNSQRRSSDPGQNNSFSNIYLYTVMLVVCCLILCLPTSPEPVAPESKLPSISYKAQLFAAMVLGMVLCTIMRR